MRAPKELRPIELHQLCAIARTVLEAAPTISDSEWKDRTKQKLAKQGWDYPSPELLEKALIRVEKALLETLGPRPVDLPSATEPMSWKPQQEDPPWNRAQPPAGWRLVESLLAQLQALPSSEPSYTAEPEASRDALDITEFQALHEFWSAASVVGANRIVLLQVFAEIAIVRPADWDPAALRAQAGEHQLFASECFACRTTERSLDWHHVIQLQHGGSNTPRNRVAICPACHADVHPWLPPGDRRAPGGWTLLGDILGIASVQSEIERAVTATPTTERK